MSGRKTAVVLFNLGGPDSPEAVRPFLRNLFADPRIIGAPGPVRLALAEFISRTRAASARANYAKMGGGSPIVPETEAQARALEERLSGVEGRTFRVFIAMRHWRPFARDAAAAMQAWGAEDVVLAPLYPQFSTTTTASSLEDFARAWPGPTKAVCCYPRDPGFAEAHAAVLREAWERSGLEGTPRVLFSAHGLPERVVKAGDPYQWQVEETVRAVVARLPSAWEHAICYQSRVGPLKWIGPATTEAIARAARDQAQILLSPIAFVSEHIETLVELDEEYRELAEHLGAPAYVRAPALRAHPIFIDALGRAVLRALSDEAAIASSEGGRLCPRDRTSCPVSCDGARK